MSARATIGRRSSYVERRVSGPSPYGGEWDHGWKREPRDQALAHARSMVGESVPWARVQERRVEIEIVAEEIVS